MQAGSTSKSSIRVNPPATKKWGEVAIDKGFITPDQLQDALEEQKRGQQTGNIELLGAVLLRRKMITREQAAAVDRAMQGTSQLAGFEILEKVGQGGMGAVFRARQISMDRTVALKILPRKLAQDPKAKERFFREARLCASMNHLNLINGIDCGEAGGYTFFAMEFVEGETARKLLKTRGRIPVKQVVDIIRQIGTALDYAHSKKLVHRDVKPENIMITPEGVAKLCDLGLSRSVANTEEDASLTQAGQAVGTPYYISPEQARGEEVDARTDIYSLGATFYHLLSGKPPFEGASAAVIMAKHLTDTASPLSSFCTDLDDGYAFIVSKMMAKAKTDRYETMKQVLADLDKVEAGESPTAASFKATSSCPRPAAGARRPTGASSPVSTTSLERPVRLTRTRTSTGSSGSARDAGSGLLIGGGIAALVLLGLVVMGTGGGGGTRPQAVAPKPQPSSVAQPPVYQPTPVQPPAQYSNRPRDPQAGHPGPNPGNRPPHPNADLVGMVEPGAKTEESMPASMLPVANKNDDGAKTETGRADPKPDASKIDSKPVATAPEKGAEPAKPVLDAKSTAMRARFLAELQKKAARQDLSRSIKDAKDLAAKPDYAAIKEALEGDIKELEGLIKYETAMAQAIGEAKPEIELPKDHPYNTKKLAGEKARVREFSNGRVMCSVSGIDAPLMMSTLPPKLVIDTAKLQGRDADAVSYLLTRGDTEEANRLLATLAESDRTRIKDKMDLIKSGEQELAAQSYFDSIAAAAKSNQWKTVWDKIPAFTQQHGATQVASEKAQELADLKAKAEDALWPLQALFKTKSVKPLADGFIEVSYDFNSNDQLKDFECEHGELSLRGGKMKVPSGGGETANVRWLPRIAELRKFEIAIKSLHEERDRMGIAFLKGKEVDRTLPMLMFWPRNQRAFLTNWDNEVRQGGPGRGNFNGSSRNEIQWLDEVPVIAEEDRDGMLKWTADGGEVGKVKMPDRAVNGNLILFGHDGNFTLSGLKLTFKPDPEWLKEARAKNAGK